MKLSIIVATGKNREIGKDNQLLWRLSDDLKLFKRTTLNHTIIMGRKTYESIGKALPKRRNVVISRNANFVAEGCELVSSLEAALDLCKTEEEVFVIGGGSIYNIALPLANQLYISEVDGSFDAEVFFPETNADEWELSHAEYYAQDEKNEYPFTFKKLHRKK